MKYEALIETLRDETVARIGEVEGRVLLVQDTTSFDFSSHEAVDGLGRLESKRRRGMFVHSSLAVSEAGLPLGLVAQQVWVRSNSVAGAAEKRHQTAFADKESYKWVKGLRDQASGQGWLQNGLTVCDREAHIYEFMAAALDSRQDFIIRAMKGRSFTEDGQDLFQAVAFQPVMAQQVITVQSKAGHSTRQATVSIRWGSLTLRRPRRASTDHQTLTMQVVEVVETQPTPGQPAVHWLLLTSLPVMTLAQARQVVRLYSYRWLIERLHFTLKSGCKFEDSQLHSEPALERLLAVYSGVAWHLLWLTYQARLTPDAPCSVVLPTAYWQALSAYSQQSAVPSLTPPSLRQAVRWIAQLGGFLARKGDGDPGVKVLWRGWSRLQDITHAWLLFHPLSTYG